MVYTYAKCSFPAKAIFWVISPSSFSSYSPARDEWVNPGFLSGRLCKLILVCRCGVAFLKVKIIFEQLCSNYVLQRLFRHLQEIHKSKKVRHNHTQDCRNETDTLSVVNSVVKF